MFRYNRPQKGREREFIQLGCEVVNSDFVYTEAEQLKCIYSFVKSLGVNFKLHLNTTGSRKSLERYVQVLREFFRQKAEHLSEKNRARLEQNVLRVLDQLSEVEKKALAKDFPKLLEHVTDEERDRFSVLCSILETLGVEFVVDQFIIRGLDYYEGCVFELVTPDYSIAGGGRYRISRKRLGGGSSPLNHVADASKPPQAVDALSSDQAGNDDIFGFGWAIGYERLVQQLEFEPEQEALYLVFALDEPQFAFEVAEILRWRENKKVRLVFGSMKKCISKANSMNPSYVVFCGTTEKQNQVLNLKNWQSGEKLESTLADPKLDF
jgi:histidyl-tRNA synthetase